MTLRTGGVAIRAGRASAAPGLPAMVVLATALLATVLSAGCAHPPPATGLDDTVLAGRLSMRVDGQPERAVSAGFELAGTAERGSLVLSGPLGATALRARWSPGEAVVQAGGSETRHADLDSLGQAALGETLPMAALFDWLRGRAWAGAAAQPRPDGLPGFRQLGWQIDLARWREGAVEAVRLAPPALTVRARLELPG